MVVKSTTNKKMLTMGFPEVMAHNLADDMKWSEWFDLPLLEGKNSGFKKQFYKRIKEGLNRLGEIEQFYKRIYRGDLETDKHIMTVALFNDNVVDVAYNIIHSLPVLTPDAKFPDLPSQGLFNWVSFEGESYQKENKMQYTQALGLFNLGLYDYNRKQWKSSPFSKSRDKSRVKQEYEDWLKRNERYRPENHPLSPYNPSNPYDYAQIYHKNNMQVKNLYDWNSANARSPQFDFANPQFKKEYDKYQKMYQGYTSSSPTK